MHPATDPVFSNGFSPRIRVRRLGVCSFDDALALQERAARSVKAGGEDELLYVEHPAVITLGRGTTPGQLLSSRRQLAAAGISVIETNRGGGATFHGPGQLVGYPIISLQRRGIGVRTYLQGLEKALIGALQSVGVAAFTRQGLTGVWTEFGKLVAIGIAVQQSVTRHGFALNVKTDLEPFKNIVSCGLRDPVTSLQRMKWDGDVAAFTGRLVAELESFLGQASVPTSRVVAFARHKVQP